MDMWLKTGTLKRLASRTEIRSTDLVAMEILWISKMIIMKCKVRLIGLFSPDLVPSDYHLLTHIKKWLGEQHFADGEELQDAVTGWLNSEAAEFYGEGI
ncbi:hypothetical protein AVEN_156430-1, partial [Araneus ventricosus]